MDGGRTGYGKAHGQAAGWTSGGGSTVVAGVSFYGLTASDMGVVALMLIVFVAAVFVPYPRRVGQNRRPDGRPTERTRPQ